MEEEEGEVDAAAFDDETKSNELTSVSSLLPCPFHPPRTRTSRSMTALSLPSEM